MAATGKQQRKDVPASLCARRADSVECGSDKGESASSIGRVFGDPRRDRRQRQIGISERSQRLGMSKTTVHRASCRR